MRIGASAVGKEAAVRETAPRSDPVIIFVLSSSPPYLGRKKEVPTYSSRLPTSYNNPAIRIPALSSP